MRQASFSAGERRIASVMLATRLIGLPLWEEARSILFFAPLPDEPDLLEAASRGFQHEKLVAFPRHDPVRDQYVPCAVENLQKTLCRGRFNIPEPTPDCPVVALNRLDLILVPGVAFDLAGHRLGRGKGYYDRLLAGVSGIKCGIAFDWQVQNEIPAESHDVRVNCLLTPTQWRQFD